MLHWHLYSGTLFSFLQSSLWQWLQLWDLCRLCVCRICRTGFGQFFLSPPCIGCIVDHLWTLIFRSLNTFSVEFKSWLRLCQSEMSRNLFLWWVPHGLLSFSLTVFFPLQTFLFLNLINKLSNLPVLANKNCFILNLFDWMVFVRWGVFISNTAWHSSQKSLAAVLGLYCSFWMDRQCFTFLSFPNDDLCF